MTEDVGVNASTDLDRRVWRVESMPAWLADTGGRATIALEHDLLVYVLLVRGGTESPHFHGDPDQRALLQ